MARQAEHKLECLVLVFCVLLGANTALGTLFSWADHVVQFTGDNFTQNVRNSDTAWMVDFYSPWCGHCQRFAPTWIEFARRGQGWSKMVRIGAIACSDPQNVGICRQYGIRGYPTVKFFSPKTHDRHVHAFGRPVNGRKTMTFLRHTTIDYLMQAMRDRTHPLPSDVTARWPTLDAIASLRDIPSAAFLPEVRFVFVIAEDTDPYLGRELILDMSAHHPVIFVTRMLRSDANAMGIRDFPSLHVHEGSAYTEPYLTEVPGATDYATMLSAMRTYVTRLASDDVRLASTTTAEVTTTPYLVSTAGPSDGLHMQDLESSLYYSLWIEVGGQATLSGRPLQALKTHLAILTKYHPGKDNVINFLNKTSQWLMEQQNLTGLQWKKGITDLQTSEAYIPDRVAWTGCDGSQPPFRGYPCSLWMTFHALTVNAIDVDGGSPEFDPQEVLNGMKDYIKHFFGCRSCARHFGKMADTIEQEVTSRTDGITWLWKAHNKANNRLHGDPSEDPVNPKIQFPRLGACSPCRHPELSNNDPFDNNTSWYPEHVLSYLRMFYGKTNIIQDALPYQFVNPATTTTEATPPIPTSADSTDPPPPPRCSPEQTPWSPCSATCDTGVSTRLDNNNALCHMKMEARLCNVRPCSTVETMRRHNDNPDHAARCPDIGSTFRVTIQGPLRYGNCHTVEDFFGRDYGSKICGLCPGTCCYPSRERTLEFHMDCGSTSGRVKVQYIDQCECPATCPQNYRLWYAGEEN